LFDSKPRVELELPSLFGGFPEFFFSASSFSEVEAERCLCRQWFYLSLGG